MSINQGLATYLAQHEVQPRPAPPIVYCVLTRWLANHNTSEIRQVTFRHIIHFMDVEIPPNMKLRSREARLLLDPWGRLATARSDAGYTQEQLYKAREEGRTGEDMVREYLSRK